MRRSEALPRGLTHGEAEVYHAGRRRRDGALVYFDIATTTMRPRFADASGWLHNLPDGVAYSDFARAYLDDYARWGGARVSVEQFLTELTISRSARCPWWFWVLYNEWRRNPSEEARQWVVESFRQMQGWRRQGLRPLADDDAPWR